MKGCGPKHFCFSALRAMVQHSGCLKEKQIASQEDDRSKESAFSLNNSNLL